MIRALLDTNVIVSGVLVPLGIPAQLLQAAQASTFAIVTSQDIVNETLRTLQRDRILRRYHLHAAQIEGVRILLELRADMAVAAADVHGVATHPEDDLVISAAVAGDADYLVTGDFQLQKLDGFEGVRIVSPRAFLEVLESQPS